MVAVFFTSGQHVLKKILPEVTNLVALAHYAHEIPYLLINLARLGDSVGNLFA